MVASGLLQVLSWLLFEKLFSGLLSPFEVGLVLERVSWLVWLLVVVSTFR